MVEANVKIMQQLQQYILLCCQDPQLRHHFITDPSDFSRIRKLPMQTVVLLIINCLKRSLHVEIQDFFVQAMQQPIACTKSAFCLQRIKLRPLLFSVLNRLLVDSFYEQYGSELKCWKGFRVLALDGSTACLLNKPALQNHFKVQNNQYGDRPMGRIVQLHDVLNNIIVAGNIHPLTTSEQAAAYQLAEQLPQEALLVCDRNFSSYALMYLLIHQEKSRHFIIRTKTHHGFKEVKDFMRSSKNSRIIDLCPSYGSMSILGTLGYKVFNHTAIKIRMIKIKLSDGTIEVLLTNLLDEQLYSVQEIKMLYALRWKIETKYDQQKNKLLLEEFSGHSVCAVEQDYQANVFISNLHSLIEKQCDVYLMLISEQRRHDYQINHSTSLALMKYRIVRLLSNPYTVIDLLLELQKIFERYLEPIRRGRHYPRTRTSKRRSGRCQTFTNFKRNL